MLRGVFESCNAKSIADFISNGLLYALDCVLHAQRLKCIIIIAYRYQQIFAA